MDDEQEGEEPTSEPQLLAQVPVSPEPEDHPDVEPEPGAVDSTALQYEQLFER